MDVILGGWWNENKRLFYTNSPKCASSSFDSLFSELDDWRMINNNEVPDDAIVFTHIRDPKLRLIKGMYQFMLGTNLLPLLDDPEKNTHILRGIWTAVLNVHLYPLNYLHEKWAGRIVFIPIDLSVDGNRLTEKFFKTHGLEYDFYSREQRNKSDNEALSYQALIKANMKLTGIFDIRIKYLAEEIKIYERACRTVSSL